MAIKTDNKLTIFCLNKKTDPNISNILAIDKIDFNKLSLEEQNNINNFKIELITHLFKTDITNNEKINALELIEIKKMLNLLLDKNYSEELKQKFNKFIKNFNILINLNKIHIMI